MAVDLGKQYGPLPLGAWIVVVGGGLGIAIWARAKANDTTQTTVDTSGQPGVGDGSVSSWVPTTPPSTAVDSGGDNATITTNEQWAVRAINWLIAQGYDATESDSAIRKYLAGNDPAPSIKEYALQNLALQHFGSPPQPLPPAVNPAPTIPPSTLPSVTPIPTPTPTPKPSPVPAPASARWYIVKAWPQKGSSLWSIAEIYYGNGAQWSRIYNANKTGVRRADGSMGMISNPNLVKPGWRLQIP